VGFQWTNWQGLQNLWRTRHDKSGRVEIAARTNKGGIMTSDHADKSHYRTHRDEWIVLAYCAGLALVLAAIEWLLH